MLRIVAGGTGFIGQALINKWLNNQHEIMVIGRSVEKIKQIFSDRVRAIVWEDFAAKSKAILCDAEVIINLAGASIADKRWTLARKQEILSSRLDTARLLAAACADLGKAAPALFNASAVGIYGTQDNYSTQLPPALDEDIVIDFSCAPDFAAKVVREWEQTTANASQAGVRVVNLRFGMVLASNGGILPRISLPFKFFLGGIMGSGKQYWPWIGLEDAIAAIEFLLARRELHGAFNLVAPESVTQQRFAKTLGNVLQRPSLLWVPAFVLRLALGELADELILGGQRVHPKRLLEAGFVFQYPALDNALHAIYS